MKIAALLIALAGLAWALVAMTDLEALYKRGKNKGSNCHFHRMDIDCDAWKAAKYPSGDSSINITQQSNPSDRYGKNLTAKAVSVCRDLPQDPKLKWLAMDYEGCNTGTASEDDAPLAHFNAIFIFPSPGCVFDAPGGWLPLGSKKNHKKIETWCWDGMQQWRSFALAKFTDERLAEAVQWKDG